MSRRQKKEDQTIEPSEVEDAGEILGASAEATAEATEIPEPTTGLDFNLKAVKEKPTRRYRKGSKYDPLLDAFQESDEVLVSVEVEGKDANYLRTQLNKRIDARRMTGFKTSVVNNVLYLEKNAEKKAEKK